jgi:hypothetical protein
MREKTYWAILEEFTFFIFKKSLQPRLRAVVAVFMAVVTFLAAVSVFRKKHLYRCRGVSYPLSIDPCGECPAQQSVGGSEEFLGFFFNE